MGVLAGGLVRRQIARAREGRRAGWFGLAGAGEWTAGLLGRLAGYLEIVGNQVIFPVDISTDRGEDEIWCCFVREGRARDERNLQDEAGSLYPGGKATERAG